MSVTCNGTNREGEPCSVTFGLSEDNGLCAHHDPARADFMAEVRAKGTRASGESRKPVVVLPDPKTIPAEMESAEDIPKWASWLAYAIATGQIDPKTGHEISIAITAFQRGHDYSEGQKKVADLKRQLAEIKKGAK